MNIIVLHSKKICKNEKGKLYENNSVYIHICIYIHTHTRKHTHTHIYIYIYIFGPVKPELGVIPSEQEVIQA